VLIPAIDLKAGQVVQLVQGRHLAIASDDVFAWVERFKGFARVQVVDLDGAMESGANEDLVRRICARLPCRVGGGVRTVAKAQALVAAGALEVIVGSSLFRDGLPDLAFARRMGEAVGRDRLIGAVDSSQGRVVIHGWREPVGVSPVEAVRRLEPFCGGFLYTHVDSEGLMGGTDMAAILAVRDATSRRVTAAGGITTRKEIEALDALGVDAVVGMAIYTGRLDVAPPRR